jgi:hypothetical protein
MNKLVLLSLVLGACTHDITSIDEADGSANVDVLYVLDTSTDRADYDAMAGQLDDLTTQLTAIDGTLPSLHVGVVTADVGIQGTDDALPPGAFRNCAGTGDGGRLAVFDAPVGDPYAEDLRGPDDTRVQNFEGELTDIVGLLSNPAAAKFGCEVAQPMEAMRRALDPAINPGFLRDKAKLMVVFLSSDDDCSLKSGSFLDASSDNGTLCASEGVVCDDDPGTDGTHTNCVPRSDGLVTPVDDYVDFLVELKGAENRVTVAAVAGPSDPFVTTGGSIEPSCTGAGGDHKPAVRLNALADAFGGAKVNGCTQDGAYDTIAGTFADR